MLLFPVCYDPLIFFSLCFPLFLLFLSLFLTDTNLSSERGKNQSHTLSLIMAFCAVNSRRLAVCTGLGGTICWRWSQQGAHKHHRHRQEVLFLDITLGVTTSVERRRNGVKSNYESSIRRPMWPIRILSLAYLPCTPFTSTHLLNLPPFDLCFSIRSQ